MANWFEEKFSPYETHRHKLKKVLRRKKTKFQNIVIAETHSFGKCLILDGELQSALADERIYHEMLVHPPLGFCRRNVSNVLILGGGEGATLREVLRWRSVKKVMMVDIDRETVDFCKKYLKEWHRNSFSDPRAEVVYEDAFNFVEKSSEKWDAVIMDLTCPLRGGPAYKLYSMEFLGIIKKHLLPDGVLCSQAGSASMNASAFHYAFYATVRKVFRALFSYRIFVPSFDVPWAFLVASGRLNSSVHAWEKIRKNVKGPFNTLNRGVLSGIGENPEYLKNNLKNCRRIISVKKPVFYFK
ncbi:MAG: spermidine synthase [bacterium]